MELEIDLRRYIQILLSRWKFVLAAAVVAGVAAMAASFALPAIYEARAGLIVSRARSQVTFEPKFQTLSEEELTSMRVDPKVRQYTLEALVRSPVVEAEVIEELGSVLEPEERTPGALLRDGIEVAVTRGELIEVVWRDRDPSRAAVIANTWARSYEAYVNELYGGSADIPDSVGTQLISSKENYEKAQATLTEFRGNNRIKELSLEIAAKEDTLDFEYRVVSRTHELIADARALVSQIGEGHSSAIGSLASGLGVLRLQTGALTASAGAPFELQLVVDDNSELLSTAEDQRMELESLITVLESWQSDAYVTIRESSLLDDILHLQEQLEMEQARETELLRARDLAWQTFTTVARKADEVSVAVQTAGSEVKFAVPAIEPADPVLPKKTQNAVIAGALGLILGVFGAFAMEYRAGAKRTSER